MPDTKSDPNALRVFISVGPLLPYLPLTRSSLPLAKSLRTVLI